MRIQKIPTDKQMTVQSGGTPSLIVWQSSVSSSPASNSAGGNARAFDDGLEKSSTEPWRDKDLFFSFRITSQQANVLIIPCPAAAARCSFEQNVLRTPLMSISVSPRPAVRVMFLSFLKWRFASEFQQDFRSSDHGS